MKQLTKSLFVLMLMLGTMLEMKAADVYLLTAQTINGSVGKYEVPSAGESGEPVVRSATDVEPGYYLVGNFFSPYNKGGEYNPGGDGATIDYTKHVYFKFEQQKDKSYSFSIPACLTAHAQILAVAEDNSMMVYDRVVCSDCTEQRMEPLCPQQTVR